MTGLEELRAPLLAPPPPRKEGAHESRFRLVAQRLPALAVLGNAAPLLHFALIAAKGSTPGAATSRAAAAFFVSCLTSLMLLTARTRTALPGSSLRAWLLRLAALEAASQAVLAVAALLSTPSQLPPLLYAAFALRWAAGQTSPTLVAAAEVVRLTVMICAALRSGEGGRTPHPSSLAAPLVACLLTPAVHCLLLEPEAAAYHVRQRGRRGSPPLPAPARIALLRRACAPFAAWVRLCECAAGRALRHEGRAGAAALPPGGASGALLGGVVALRCGLSPGLAAAACVVAQALLALRCRTLAPHHSAPRTAPPRRGPPSAGSSTASHASLARGGGGGGGGSGGGGGGGVVSSGGGGRGWGLRGWASLRAAPRASEAGCATDSGGSDDDADDADAAALSSRIASAAAAATCERDVLRAAAIVLHERFPDALAHSITFFKPVGSPTPSAQLLRASSAAAAADGADAAEEGGGVAGGLFGAAPRFSSVAPRATALPADDASSFVLLPACSQVDAATEADRQALVSALPSRVSPGDASAASFACFRRGPPAHGGGRTPRLAARGVAHSGEFPPGRFADHAAASTSGLGSATQVTFALFDGDCDASPLRASFDTRGGGGGVGAAAAPAAPLGCVTLAFASPAPLPPHSGASARAVLRVASALGAAVAARRGAEARDAAARLRALAEDVFPPHLLQVLADRRRGSADSAAHPRVSTLLQAGPHGGVPRTSTAPLRGGGGGRLSTLGGGSFASRPSISAGAIAAGGVGGSSDDGVSLASLTRDHADTTCIFADVVGWTRIAAGMPPAATMELLSRLFGRFDGLAVAHGVYKARSAALRTSLHTNSSRPVVVDFRWRRSATATSLCRGSCLRAPTTRAPPSASRSTSTPPPPPPKVRFGGTAR